jgi:U3 small nucleolar RNA-associated protein 14
MTIAEAFDDDDVVEEFMEEKRRQVEEEREQDEDLFLPGWGGWAGPGVTPNKRLKQR